MTTETSKEKTFDYSKYQIDNAIEEKILTIPETNETFKIKVKPLSWSRRNQIMSKCITWTQNGQTGFDGDAFVRGCLREMIVEAPWGSTNDMFLMSIDQQLGKALEEIIPSAFEAGDNTPLKKD